MPARSSSLARSRPIPFGLRPWLLLVSIALVMCSPKTCRAWYFNCGADTVGCLTANADTVGCSLVVSGPIEGFVWAHHSMPTVMVAEKTAEGDVWMPSQVGSADRLGPGLSLAFDKQGHPAVAYCDGLTGALHVAWRGGERGSAFSAIDAPDNSGHVLQYPVLSATPEGWAIAYVDSNAGTLKYAEKIGADAWKTATVDPAHHARRLSMVVRGTARAISYYDRMKGDLRVAIRSAGAWTSAAVDTGGVVGLYSSIADNPVTNRLGVAYYDRTHGRLKYAYQSSKGVWKKVVVDSTGDVGRYCSLVQLGNSVADSLVITYYDATQGTLRYARRIGGWASGVLDSNSDAGTFSTAIVVGDELHVGYVGRDSVQFLKHSALH